MTGATTLNEWLAAVGMRDLALARQELAERLRDDGVDGNVADSVSSVPRHPAMNATSEWRLAHAHNLASGSVPTPLLVALVIETAGIDEEDSVLVVESPLGWATAVIARHCRGAGARVSTMRDGATVPVFAPLLSIIGVSRCDDADRFNLVISFGHRPDLSRLRPRGRVVYTVGRTVHRLADRGGYWRSTVIREEGRHG
jgi:hypothetical protein